MGGISDPLTDSPDRIITTREALADLVRSLERADRLAVDVEADSLHRYEEQPCLLQISTDEETWIVDPLAIGGLGPLGPIFGDPAVEKVFHGADYDIRLLKRAAGFDFSNIFDTMISAQLLGLPEVGLQSLLASRFGVALDKRFQRADWSKRPLAPEMIRYAAEDTRHLLRLRDELASELDPRGRMEWAREEFEILCRIQPAPRRPPSWSDVKGSGKLPPRDRAVLQALVEFRDGEARRLDRPPFKVLGNPVLLELARRRPRTPDDLQGIVGLTPRLVDRYGRAILGAAQKAETVPADAYARTDRGRPPKPSPEQIARLARLKAVRDEAARNLDIAPALLANRAALEEIAASEPDALAATLAARLKNWQRSVLEKEFERVRRLADDRVD
ncbi:MAG: ribonuclease D [Nitrospirae bacterium]|nr:ribonuclease D [Nitrospirota bacterium]